MTRCLFVMEDWPITPVGAGGTPALVFSHLELLSQAVDQIDLAILCNPDNPLGFQAYQVTQPEIWAKVSGWCREIYKIDLGTDGGHLPAAFRLLASFFNPALYSYHDIFISHGAKQLSEIILANVPDIIWAEHLVPATLLQHIKPSSPLVYSHQDWRWKIKAHRTGESSRNIKGRIKFWFSRKHETQLVRDVTACVSGSASELGEMRALGVRQLGYFPTTYETVDLPIFASVKEVPRIVHLGGMQTTANRLGLQRFLEVCWPSLITAISPSPELWVIGDLKGANPTLLSALKQKNIIITGMVQDLRTVLRPYDIHIVPWEFDTGTRTRIPLVLNHGQVLVSTLAAAACISELVHKENCVLVKNLDEMASVIIDLYKNNSEREGLARRGRETFLKCFTREAQQTRFNDFIKELMTGYAGS